MSYSIQSTISELLASDSAREVIDKYLPGASSHPKIDLARAMSLAAVAQLAGQLIPQGTLDRIDAALRAL